VRQGEASGLPKLERLLCGTSQERPRNGTATFTALFGVQQGRATRSISPLTLL